MLTPVTKSSANVSYVEICYPTAGGAFGQKQTFAGSLFDHPVGAQEKRLRQV